MKLLLRAAARHYLGHRWQLALALAGVALGIAVVVAIDLATSSVQRAFEASSARVAGRATDYLVGGSDGLDERDYAALRTRFAVAAAPVVSGHVRLAADPRRGLTLLGIDPFADPGLRPLAGVALGGARLGTLVTTPGAVLVPASLAAEPGVIHGDRIDLLAGGRRVRALVAGRIETDDPLTARSFAGVVVADLSTAQELLGRVGWLDRVDLRLPDGDAGRRLRARITAWLPPGAALLPAAEEAHQARELTRAFDLNLDMLGLLALLVGTFLIYNTVSFAVVQRREIFGRVRALGVTRAQIGTAVLAEALLLGAVGALAGVALGYVLAGRLLGLVAHTVNDLYYTVDVEHLTLAPGAIAEALGFGCAAALVAAAVPAVEALAAPAGTVVRRSTLEAASAHLARRAGWCGLAVAALGAALLALPGERLATGFGAMFALVTGAALVAPAVTARLLAVLVPAGRRAGGLIGHLAMRSARASLSRTAVAVAALMVALSASVGIGVMVDSFRRAVGEWLNVTLQADLYVGAPGTGAVSAIGPDLIAAIRALPEVAELSLGRRGTVRSPGGPVEVLALEPATRSPDGFPLLAGDPRDAWARFADGAVLVSEPLANHRRLGLGDHIVLNGDHGPAALEIAGIYRDYGSERGKVLMSRATWDRYWDARGHTALGVYLRPGADEGHALAAIRALVPAGHALRVRPSAAIREISLRVFDRTFAITEVLRALATLIAFVGVLGALMALELDRAREIAMLRATGFTRGQIWWLVETQTGVLGLIAGALAVPLGLAVGVLLIEVVNRRAFGWTMPLHVDPRILGEVVALATVAGLLAAVLPCRRMVAAPPAAALRNE